MSSLTTYSKARPRRLALPALRDHAAEWAVLGLTAAAFGIRASQLHQTLVGDEMLAFSEIVQHSLGQTLHLVHSGVESSPPLFFVFAWLSVKLGDPTIWIRLPSLVLGSATVPLIFLIGRESVGRLAGLIGAAVLALAPFPVYYGIEARPYATMTFFVALSTLALLRAVRTGSAWWWGCYALSAVAAAYSHYTCVFVLAVQAAWSMWACRSRPRQPLIAAAAIVLLYLPWLPYLHGKDLGAYQSLYPLTLHHVLADLLRPIPAHPDAPLRAIPTIAGLAVFGVCTLAGLLALTRRVRRVGRPSSELALVAASVVATPAGILLYSLIVRDIWLPRNLSASLPALALAVGALLAALPWRLGALSAGAVCVVLLAGTLRSFEPAYARGPYRAIAGYLDHTAGAKNPVTIISWLGAPAIPAEFHKPHLLVRSASLWRSSAGRAYAYLVLDDTIARILRIGIPHQPGFRLIARRHYAGRFPTDVLTYRPLGAGG